MHYKKIEFDYWEFECHCNNKDCNRKESYLKVLSPLNNVLYTLMCKLDTFKDFVRCEKKTENVIISISSGARCEKWNILKGGVKNSFHKYNDLKFIAIDSIIKIDGEKLSEKETITLYKKFFGKKIVYIAPTSNTKGAIHTTFQME